MDIIKLRPEQADLLAFIEANNRTDNDIANYFNIAKTTVTTRLYSLMNLDLVRSVKEFKQSKYWMINAERSPYTIVVEDEDQRRKVKVRNCNLCKKAFRSENMDRTCADCKKTDVWRSGNVFYSLLDK